MKLLCAWCEKDLGEVDPKNDKSITHGMCRYCSIKERLRSCGRRTMKNIYWLFFGFIMGLVIGFLIWGM
jgi:hypothetical protein